MKNLVLSFFLFQAIAASVCAQSTNMIQRIVLDPMTVTRIPVATDRLTTIRFPSEVSDMESALVASELHSKALFILSYQTGNAFFTVRALVARTNTTLNVTWKGQTYVLDLAESANPWLSVIFDPPSDTVAAKPQLVTPSRLLGLLDTAKAYGLLREQHSVAVAGVEVARPNTLYDYGDYTINIEEVFRFEPEDTLIFRIGVSNKTSEPIHFVPQSVMVRAGQRFFYQSITDAAGVLPACTLLPIYFAITGSTDGSRNALSTKNDFMVMLNRLDSVRPPSTSSAVQSNAPTALLAVVPRRKPPQTEPAASSKSYGSKMVRRTPAQLPYYDLQIETNVIGSNSMKSVPPPATSTLLTNPPVASVPKPLPAVKAMVGGDTATLLPTAPATSTLFQRLFNISFRISFGSDD